MALLAAHARRMCTARVIPAAAAAVRSYVSPSADAEEMRKFAKMADSWWDPKGPYAALHAMNPTRVSFIRKARFFCLRTIEGPEVVGCWMRRWTSLRGKALSLARLGANVTGIDLTAESVKVAQTHALRNTHTPRIRYMATSAENLLARGETFDAVLALEVIEHTASPAQFVKTLVRLTNYDGALCISTINRTPRSYALAILGAEYILRWVPKGTHDWNRFVTPEELALMLQRSGAEMESLAGMVYNPLSREWSLVSDDGVNYIAAARRTFRGGGRPPQHIDVRASVL
eukprot:jgi/Chlat1/1008/Chrsp109S01457